ncbi:MAG: type II and III secretion system protein family protein [Bdellovibrionales bacterium]|jgi:pilus assembly protein CpaC
MRLSKVSSLSSLVIVALCAGLMLSPLRVHGATPDKTVKAEKLDKAAAEKRPTALEVLIDKSVPVTFNAPAATVFIANPDIADVQVFSPTSVMVYGKKEGHTTLRITDRDGHDLVYKTVMVTQNLAALRDALRTVLPNSNIKVESIPNGIVLSGDVSDASAVEDARRVAVRYIPKDGDIINRIHVKANNQIQIRVRFAEVSRDVDKRFGINWETIGTVGGFAFGLATGADVVSTSLAGVTSFNRTSMGDGDVNNALAASYNNGHHSVNAMIDALAKNGLVTILAEPSLTAMSGETASFLAGGEFPVPVPQNQNITIEWKQYGVSLAFTPTIIGDGRINLHVRPEVSQLSAAGGITLGGVQVPGLTTRRAETTIELNSGQSFAIAGLLNNQQTQSVDKYPFLGDIPVLGPLFRSTRFQNNESELVIIITPYIVKPATQEQLALPTDGFAPPSDTDRLFRMRETNSDPAARALSGAPRAVTVENPVAEESPAPSAAPVAPVSYQEQELPATNVTAKNTALPMSSPIPAPSKPKAPAPQGPGGFIVE